MDSLSDAIHDALLVVVDKHVLLLRGRVPFPLLSGSQLRDQIKTLLLALEHHVLLGTAAQEALEQDDGAHLLVAFFPLVLILGKLTLAVVDLAMGTWSMRSEGGLFLFVLLVGGLLGALLLRGQLDVLMSLVKGALMVAILP